MCMIGSRRAIILAKQTSNSHVHGYMSYNAQACYIQTAGMITISMSIYIFAICLPVCRYFCIYVFISHCLSVCLYVCQSSVCLFVCLPVMAPSAQRSVHVLSCAWSCARLFHSVSFIVLVLSQCLTLYPGTSI